jgi:hypothetical protein
VIHSEYLYWYVNYFNNFNSSRCDKNIHIL